MFDDQHGVSQIAQLFERAQQTFVIPGVQPDGRLIEYIQNATQAGTDLRGQADALRFTAGKRGCGTVQAEIAQTNGKKKIEALGDLFQRTPGNFLMAGAEVRDDFVHGGARGLQRERGESRDGISAEFDGQRFRAQAFAVAVGALRGGHVLRHPLAVRIRARLREIIFKILQDALKTKILRAADLFTSVIGARFAVGRRVSVQQHVLHTRGQLVEWCIQIELMRVGRQLQRAL